jgi:rhodanese-related sulfurtransferase
MSEQYAGDIRPSDCFAQLKNGGIVIDVRTRAEWSYVGFPDLENFIPAEWQSFPTMAVNENFIAQVSKDVAGLGGTKDTPLYFLCRSGVRSRAAAIAMTGAGYEKCYNILDGFEGPPDGSGHRGKLAGWKKENLPWRQP